MKNSSSSILKQSLQRYLEKDSTDCAFMIYGSWGAGKTFFLSSFLAKYSKSVKTQVIYASAFGCKSANDIKKNLFGFLFGAPGSWIQKLVNFVKGPLGKFTGLSINLDWSDLPIACIKMLAGDSKIVVVIDDVERAECSATELFSVVQSLLEELACSTILVCNRDQAILRFNEAKDKGDDTFLKYLEKIVDIQFEFSSDPIEFYKLLCNGKESLSLKILEDSNSNFSRIVRGVTNLRTVKKIHEVSHEIEGHISELDGYRLDMVFSFIAAITNELKETGGGSQKYSDVLLSWIAQPILFDVTKASDEELDEVERTINGFLHRYGLTGGFKQFTSLSIFNLLKRGYLDVEQLKGEIASLSGKLEAHEAFMNQSRFLSLSDDEFQAQFDENLEKIKNGKIPGVKALLKTVLVLGKYISEGYVEMDLKQFESIVKEGVAHTQFENYEYLDDEPYFLSGHGFPEPIVELVNLIQSKNKKAREDAAKSESLQTFSELQSGDRDINDLYSHRKPFFQYIDINQFVRFVTTLSASDLADLRTYLRGKVNMPDHFETNEEERAAIRDLMAKLSEFVTDEKCLSARAFYFLVNDKDLLPKESTEERGAANA